MCYDPRCPSVCLSVTSRCSVKTAKRATTQTTPRDRRGILFSDAKGLDEIPVESPMFAVANFLFLFRKSEDRSSPKFNVLFAGL